MSYHFESRRRVAQPPQAEQEYLAALKSASQQAGTDKTKCVGRPRRNTIQLAKRDDPVRE
jgi:hypothetical protein